MTRRLPATLLAALAAWLGAAGTASASCADADLEATAENRAAVADALLCEMNARRTAAGLAPLRRNTQLDRSARYHAEDMAFFSYFAHRRDGGPSLLTRIRATGYFDGAADGLYTENLADAPSGRAQAAAVVEAWMQSAYHRENLLVRQFRDAGIATEPVPPAAAFYTDYPSVLFVVDYGRRYQRKRGACAAQKTKRCRPRQLGSAA